MTTGPTQTQTNPAAPMQAISAMRHRAAQLVLTMAWLGRRDQMHFGQGSLKALDELLNHFETAQFTAQRDASMGGYQPLGGFEAAWAALPEGLEYLTMAQVQQFLQSHAVEFPPDNVAHSQLNAGLQLKDGKVTAVDTHDEHGTAQADLNDVTGHVAAPVVKNPNVAEVPV